MKNQYTVTQKLYRGWALENLKRGFYLTMSLLWVGLGIILLVLAFFLNSPMYSVCAVLAFLFCLYQGFFRVILSVNMQYKVMAKQYGTENWQRTVELTENGISLYEGTLSADFPYADIVKVTEKDNLVRIRLNNKTVIRMYKDSFTEGSWEECIEFLSEKGVTI